LQILLLFVSKYAQHFFRYLKYFSAVATVSRVFNVAYTQYQVKTT